MKNVTAHQFGFCPECGLEKPGVHSDRFFSCKACGFRFFFNTAATVTAFIENDHEELLLCRRGIDPGKNTLDLPGGFIEGGETAEEALRREVKEELNLDIESMQYLGSMPGDYHYDGWRYDVLNMIFHCRVDNFRPIKANSDIAEYRFVNKNRINLSEIGLESIRNIIREYQNPNKNNRSTGGVV
jgi:NADH pyrophosphatase NudC (nudix superfamily)